MITGVDRGVFIKYNAGALSLKAIIGENSVFRSTIYSAEVLNGAYSAEVITGDDRDVFSSILFWGLISRM